MRAVFIATVAALTFGGCAKAAPRTVEFYLAHPEERRTTLARCEKTNTLGTSVDCQNALKAGNRAATKPAYRGPAQPPGGHQYKGKTY